MRLLLGMLAGVAIVLAERWLIEHIVNRVEARWRRAFGK